jgi:hypothetical protein
MAENRQVLLADRATRMPHRMDRPRYLADNHDHRHATDELAVCRFPGLNAPPNHA